MENPDAPAVAVAPVADAGAKRAAKPRPVKVKKEFTTEERAKESRKRHNELLGHVTTEEEASRDRSHSGKAQANAPPAHRRLGWRVNGGTKSVRPYSCRRIDIDPCA